MHERIEMLAPTLLLLNVLAPPLIVSVRDFQSLIPREHLPSPKTASISSNGTPIVSGYTGSTLVRTSCYTPMKKLTEVNYASYDISVCYESGRLFIRTYDKTARAEKSMHWI